MNNNSPPPEDKHASFIKLIEESNSKVNRSSFGYSDAQPMPQYNSNSRNLLIANDFKIANTTNPNFNYISSNNN